MSSNNSSGNWWDGDASEDENDRSRGVTSSRGGTGSLYAGRYKPWDTDAIRYATYLLALLVVR